MLQRPLLLLSALVLLACAGAPGLPRTTRTLQAFSVVTVAGEPVEYEDHGLDGMLEVTWVVLHQVVFWNPIPGPSDRETRLRDMWNGFQDIRGEGGAPPGPAEMPPLRDVPAGSGTGRGWTWETSDGWSAGTAVDCPSSGVQILVLSEGARSSAEPLHAETLASIRCAASPPAAATTGPAGGG
jgi:hypothetical protein